MSDYLAIIEPYQHLCERALKSKLTEIYGKSFTLDLIIKGVEDGIKIISDRANLLEHKLKWWHPFWKKKNPNIVADISAYKQNIEYLEKKLEPYNEQKAELVKIELSVWLALLRKA